MPGAIHFRSGVSARQWRTLDAMRDHPVVVYCGHGPRAYIAGAALKRRGFTNVTYLEGHMKKWKQLGLPCRSRPDRV